MWYEHRASWSHQRAPKMIRTASYVSFQLWRFPGVVNKGARKFQRPRMVKAPSMLDCYAMDVEGPSHRIEMAANSACSALYSHPNIYMRCLKWMLFGTMSPPLAPIIHWSSYHLLNCLGPHPFQLRSSWLVLGSVMVW